MKQRVQDRADLFHLFELQALLGDGLKQPHVFHAMNQDQAPLLEKAVLISEEITNSGTDSL